MYVNYHCHRDDSNLMLPDSVATMEDYAKRAVELGHTVLSSCAHGTQGNYWLCASTAEKYGLKWRYVSEAYFVLDREERWNSYGNYQKVPNDMLRRLGYISMVPR